MAKVRFKRGFKADAERTSLKIRKELKVPSYERICCFSLSEYLKISIIPLSGLTGLVQNERSIKKLSTPNSSYSALTVGYEKERLVVYNDGHGKERQRNSIAHEFAHIILKHPMGKAFSPDGCREWNPIYEDEANWLSSVILVPEDGLFHFLRKIGNPSEGPKHFEVSEQLFRWRMNMTGAKRRLRI